MDGIVIKFSDPVSRQDREWTKTLDAMIAQGIDLWTAETVIKRMQVRFAAMPVKPLDAALDSMTSDDFESHVVHPVRDFIDHMMLEILRLELKIYELEQRR